MKKKRSGETLVEVLTAMTIFGVIFAGVSDFMTNQTLALARAKTREKMMYYAQVWTNNGDYSEKTTTTVIPNTDGKGKYKFTGSVLTIMNDAETESMSFRLQ
ncbi:MAG: prepilin-type N-terminal cleavage/methylation domain-containing protein [Synergistaceae bacterium]|nr:prepilin-type N-terminal cleavage/methylation domain-containing protein [Synergistaceae bacterium]